ncbi:MAG: selenide, water dikinase SelD [Pseudomonadota bacterium]
MKGASPPATLTHDLVLIGGGHTHALVLRRWGMNPLPGVRLTLINPFPEAAYTGMLPGYVAGDYTRAELDIDLVRLARFAGARVILGLVDGIDRDARTVQVPGRAAIRYDVLSLNVGATAMMPDLPGFADHAVAVKPLAPFARAWDGYLAGLAPGATPRVAVIGAGVAGVELALTMAERLRSDGRAARVQVVEAGAPLAALPPPGRRAVLQAAAAQGVEIHAGRSVAEVTAAGLLLAGGDILEADFVVGAAGAKPFDWLSRSGLALTGGFVDVDRFLRSTTDGRIYASGDCAHLPWAPQPKAGVYAVRAARVLYHNLRAEVLGAQRRSFRPQRDFLKLITLGGQRALAVRGRAAVAAPWVWHWKDRIDRRFMSRLQDLRALPPAVEAPHVARILRAEGRAAQPLCGGCGAKLGAEALQSVLEGQGDDAAILADGRVISTDHLRAFAPDPWLLGTVAATHAMCDIHAMGAAPEVALAQVVLPRMAARLEPATLAEIMHAARQVFAAEGAQLVGGHTSIGAEMSVGFTVTGRCTAAPIRLAGARLGDALILTKPLGSGTILAAEMALKAPGGVVAGLWRALAQSQAAAAQILAGAHAMTDVTGFGLAGHLMGMLRAAELGAALRGDAVPVLPGAQALAQSGIASTLAPANRMLAPDLAAQTHPVVPLLFDPQTSGGLLAAVAPSTADACCAALVDAGYTARRIGAVTDGPPRIRLL